MLAAMNTQIPFSRATLALAVALMAGPAAAEEPDTQVVVVTASRHAMLATQAPASMAVVTREAIAARGADQLLDALRAEPGITLQGRAIGGRKGLALRGMDPRHTLFLVDGRRVNASDGVIGNSDFQYDWAAVEDIERIEVVRGPLSVLYGSDALGGVANVITRPAGERWRFSALGEASHAEGGRGGSGHRLALSAAGPLGGGLTLRAGAAETFIAPVASPADTRISELEGRLKQDGWVGVAWRGAVHSFEAEHREGDEERRADARERSGARRYHVTVNDVERRLDTLSWEAATEALSTRLRAYRSEITVSNSRSAGVAINVPQAQQDDVLEGQLRFGLGAHTLTAGFESRNETLEDPGLPGGASLAEHRGVFLQDEIELGRAATLTAGLRRDEHSLYGDHWSPRLYGVWRVAPQWTLKAGASHGFKAPNLKQIVPGSRAEGPNTFIGNADLTPERSRAVEAGVTWAVGASQAQAVVFEQRVQDLIEIVQLSAGNVPGTGTYTYRNLSEARVRGLELSLAQPLGAGFAAAANAGYLDARDGNGRRLDRRPRLTLAARLDWSAGPWRAGLQADHSGSQLMPAATAGAPSQPVPACTLWGAQVSRELPHGLQLSFGGSNLGNRRLQDLSPLFTQVEAPRSWRLALRGRW